jgi:hypothetical protein
MILADDCLDSLRMLQGNTEPSRGTIVKHVDTVCPGWIRNLGQKGVDGLGNVVESVGVVVRYAREAEGWEVRGNDMVMRCENRN